MCLVTEWTAQHRIQIRLDSPTDLLMLLSRRLDATETSKYWYVHLYLITLMYSITESDAVWVQELANTVAFVLRVYVATFVIFLLSRTLQCNGRALGVCCIKVLVSLRFCGSPHTWQAPSSGTHPVFKAGFLFEWWHHLGLFSEIWKLLLRLPFKRMCRLSSSPHDWH